MPQFDTLTEDDRRGAMGTLVMPIHPTADSAIAQADRQQVVGVYPNVLAGEAAITGGFWFYYHHHFGED